MKKIFKWSFVLFLGIILFFIWFGFFFPNPTMQSWSVWNVQKFIFLWAPRIFIPLFYCVIIFLIFTKNRNLAKNLGTLLITLVILFLIAVPILYFLKANSDRKSAMKQYHPYLQIKPPVTDVLNHQSKTDAYRIFCLGGSTTEYKNSKGIGWTGMLEGELRQRYNTDSIIVYNFGRAWYTTLHSLINYETNLRHHRPDMIIVMHNINDLLQNADFSFLSVGPFREDYGHFLGPVVNVFNSKYTGLIGRAKTKFRTMWYYDFPKKSVIETDYFPGLEPFSRNINTLIDLALTDSIKVLLISQPNILSENMDEMTKNACVMINYEAVGKYKKWGFHTAYEGMKQYNGIIKDIAEKRQVNFIDLEKQIPKSLTYFQDDVHYTDTTFNIISKFLAEEIVRLKLIQN